MNPSLQTTDRQIRVFISSTFRDMQAERDILIKKIFPQLRKLCEERAVTWTEVDLRWGITTEQAAEGKVLPLCLEEIHRCRPYFIGLLGGRYGWVPEPDSIPADLLESQPWLKQHLDLSVTELEILHGVFREEPMHGHAYFYFRDPKYLESVPTEERQDFATENAEAVVKLAKLKQKIRGARDEQVCELRENYSTPEQLGDWILKDFIKLIDRLYPKDQTPDALDQEAARHEAYARSRRLAFVGREDLLCRLNEHAAVSGKPIVLTGESGCGKSALLAEWVARWREAHPDDLIIQHYIGSTPDSADWQGLVRRILSELKRAFAITDEFPVQPDALRSSLNEWTVKAAGSRQVVLVLDALNQLAEDGAARQLGWLPVAFPANFRLLVSSLPGASLDVLRKRGWPDLNVPLFARADIAPAALAYFKIFSKAPPPDLVAKLESTPAARNALYLRAVLDELRQFGKHEELQAKAADYLSAPALPELFDRILTRWHDDFGKATEHPGLVRRSLCFIACARFGLAETELLELLGDNGEPMPRSPWTPFYLAAENALALRAGLLNFGHDYLRAAVRKRWLKGAEAQRTYRLEMAVYFASFEITSRSIAELPWLLCQTESWHRLNGLLANITWFAAVWTANELDALTYWKLLEDNSPFRMLETYGDIVNASRDQDVPIAEADAFRVAELLYRAGHPEEASVIYQQFIAHCRRTGNDAALHPCLGNQAVILAALGKLEAAEELQKESQDIAKRIGDQRGYAVSLANRANLLFRRGSYDDAARLYEEAEHVRRRLNDKRGIAIVIGNRAVIRYKQGDLDGARMLLEEQQQLSHEIGAIDVLAVSLGNEAEIHIDDCKFDVAAQLLDQQETLFRQFGMREMLGRCLEHKAGILRARGEFEKALNMHREAETIFRDQKHLSGLAITLGNQGNIHLHRGEFEQALQCYEESEQIHRELGEKEGIASSLGNRAMVYWEKHNRVEALSLLRQQEKLSKEIGEAGGVVFALFHQARIYSDCGDVDQAWLRAYGCYELVRSYGLTGWRQDVEKLLGCIQQQQLNTNDKTGE